MKTKAKMTEKTIADVRKALEGKAEIEFVNKEPVVHVYYRKQNKYQDRLIEDVKKILATFRLIAVPRVGRSNQIFNVVDMYYPNC
jgi:hypothetical protein